MKGLLWTLAGAVFGGLSGWFAVVAWLGAQPRRRYGDPAGAWAQGMADLVTAFQGALARVILGAIVGAAVYLHRKSRKGKAEGSDVRRPPGERS